MQSLLGPIVGAGVFGVRLARVGNPPLFSDDIIESSVEEPPPSGVSETWGVGGWRLMVGGGGNGSTGRSVWVTLVEACRDSGKDRKGSEVLRKVVNVCADWPICSLKGRGRRRDVGGVASGSSTI